MLKQMNAQYIVSFEPQSAIKEKQQLIQETLSSYFPPASYSVIGLPLNAAVPPEIPSEVPRIMAISRFGHSSLYISETELRLNTAFDQAYCENLSTCWLYLKERIDKINALIKSISDGRILFGGIISDFVEEDIKNPVAFIRENYITNGVHEDIYDILARMTYVKSDRYYINVALSNLRAGQDEALGISVDVNNRYEYNIGKGAKNTDDAALKGLQELYAEFLAHDLPPMVM